MFFWMFTTIVPVICSIIFNQYNKQKKIEKLESLNIKFGVISLLKSEIVKTHEKCVNKGFCTIYEIELANEIYKTYFKLGGNGCCSKLINDIKSLPIK